MDIVSSSRALFNSPPPPPSNRSDPLSAYSFPGPRPQSATIPDIFPLYESSDGEAPLASAPPYRSHFVLRQESQPGSSSEADQLPRSMSNAGFEDLAAHVGWDLHPEVTYSALGQAVLQNRVESFAPATDDVRYPRTIYSPRQYRSQAVSVAPIASTSTLHAAFAYDDTQRNGLPPPIPTYSPYQPDMIYTSSPPTVAEPLPASRHVYRPSASPDHRLLASVNRSPGRYQPYAMTRTASCLSDTDAYRFGTQDSSDFERSVTNTRISPDFSSSSSSDANRPAVSRAYTTPTPRKGKARASRLANPALFHPTPALMLAPEIAQERQAEGSRSTSASIIEGDDFADLPTKKSRGRQPLTAGELRLPPHVEPEHSLEEQAYAGVTKTGKAKKVWRCKVSCLDAMCCSWQALNPSLSGA